MTAQTDAGTTGVVDEGDVLFVPGENLTFSTDPTITVKIGETQYTFEDPNAEFAVSEAPGILITVKSTPTDKLLIEGLIVESTEGIECAEVTAIGELTSTPSCDVALRTKGSKGEPKVLPLVAQPQSKEDELEELAASKLGKVKVTGVKVKDKSAKKVKGQKQKEALNVTSVKKTNKK